MLERIKQKEYNRLELYVKSTEFVLDSKEEPKTNLTLIEEEKHSDNATPFISDRIVSGSKIHETSYN